MWREMCTHHWLIAFPEGPTSKGRCKWCGVQKWFRNSEDYYAPDARVAAHKMYSTPGAKLTAAMVAEGYRE